MDYYKKRDIDKIKELASKLKDYTPEQLESLKEGYILSHYIYYSHVFEALKKIGRGDLVEKIREEDSNILGKAYTEMVKESRETSNFVLKIWKEACKDRY